MDPAAVFLFALGVWVILAGVILPNVPMPSAELPEEFDQPAAR